MKRSGSILKITKVAPGTKRGGHSPFMSSGPAPSPCNCSEPCCYGRGRSFCWPCMKNIMGGFRERSMRAERGI